MEITAKIKNRLRERFEKELKRSRKDTAITLSAWARSVARAEKHAMVKQLDRPTPFTLRGVLYTPANERTLAAVVYIRPIQAKYLIHQVEGITGTKIKPVPASTAQNKYGNLPRKASKRKRAFVIKGKSGKKHLLQRKGKRKVVLLATYSKRRIYKKGRYDFYGVANKTIKKFLRGLR